MKFLTFTLATLFCSSAAFTAELNMEGNFAFAHQTFVVGYEDEKSCLEDQGEWDKEMEMCFFPVEDTVQVKKAVGGFDIAVETVGSNAHMCGFEGPAQKTSDSTLLSSVKTEVWEENAQTGQWESVPAVCEVTVTYRDENTVSVENNGKCQEFCGMRAWLSIDEAKRK